MGKTKRIFVINLFLISAIVLLTKPVHAEKIAGKSAVLTSVSSTSKQELISLQKKKIAIKKVLERYNSPLAGSVDAFMETCQKYDLDCYLLPAISGLESTYGKFIWPDSHNPFGWGRGYLMYETWADCIEAVGKGLRQNYANKGAVSVEQIGPIYSESPTWAPRVQLIMNQFKTEEDKVQLYFDDFSVQL